MLKILIGLISFAVILFSFNYFSEPTKDQMINDILEKTANQLQKKYGIEAIGTGGSEDNGKETLIGIDFRIYHPLAIKEARKMILDSVKILLENINNNENLKNHLVETPFPRNRVDITIYISKNHEEVLDPEITLVSFYKDKVVYRTLDPEDSFKYKSRITETYEEALQKLKESED